MTIRSARSVEEGFMKKQFFAGAIVVAALTLLGFGVVPVSRVNAQTYNGTTIQAQSNGIYQVTARAGDTVTLVNVGGSGGSITITFSNNVSGSITVQKTSGRPGGASSDAPGQVYAYYSVTLNGISNNDIASATWNFSVEKSWMDARGLGGSNISMMHFQGNWTQLPTQQTASNQGVALFSSQVNSFSPFAIAGKEGLINTGSPYALGAVVGTGMIAIGGGSYYLSRRRKASQ